VSYADPRKLCRRLAREGGAVVRLDASLGLLRAVAPGGRAFHDGNAVEVAVPYHRRFRLSSWSRMAEALHGGTRPTLPADERVSILDL
jgi:hypothetical protein